MATNKDEEFVYVLARQFCEELIENSYNSIDVLSGMKSIMRGACNSQEDCHYCVHFIYLVMSFVYVIRQHSHTNGWPSEWLEEVCEKYRHEPFFRFVYGLSLQYEELCDNIQMKEDKKYIIPEALKTDQEHEIIAYEENRAFFLEDLLSKHQNLSTIFDCSESGRNANIHISILYSTLADHCLLVGLREKAGICDKKILNL